MAKFLDYFSDSDIQIVLGAHIHQYRRTKPLTREATVGSFSLIMEKDGGVTYLNPKKSTVFLVEGAAGSSDYV